MRKQEIIQYQITRKMSKHVIFVSTVCRMAAALAAAAAASPASVTSPLPEAGPTNIIKMFTTYTNILTEASMSKCSTLTLDSSLKPNLLCSHYLARRATFNIEAI